MAMRHILGIVLGLSLYWNGSSGAKSPQESNARRMALPKVIQTSLRRELRHLAYSPKLQLLAFEPAFFRLGPNLQGGFPIYLWNLQTGKRQRILLGHRQRIDYVGFSPDGSAVISSAMDGLIAWDPLKGTADRTHLAAVVKRARLLFSRKEVVNWNDEGDLIIWDGKTGRKEQVLKAPKTAKKGLEHIDDFTCTISPDEQWIILGAGLSNHKMLVWNQKKRKFHVGLSHHNRLFRLSFSKTGRFLFGSGNEVRKGYLGRGTLDIWDTRSWKHIRTIEVDEFRVRPVTYLPDREMVLTVDTLKRSLPDRNTYHTSINGYPIKTGKRLISFNTEKSKVGYCSSALYLEDRSVVCIANSEGQIHLFKLSEVLKHKTGK